eukprot:gene5251-5304_t
MFETQLGIIPGVTLDDFRTASQHHFVTHFHADHFAGLAAFDFAAAVPAIHCSTITRDFILARFPNVPPSAVTTLREGQTEAVSVALRGGGTLRLSVTAFDANHCPGAVLLVFDGPFGRVLYSGDFRFTAAAGFLDEGFGVWESWGDDEDAETSSVAGAGGGAVPARWEAALDFIRDRPVDRMYVDDTFLWPALWHPVPFPTRGRALQAVLRLIEQHGGAKGCRVYVSCDVLGSEDLIMGVATHLGQRFLLDNTLMRSHRADTLMAMGAFRRKCISTDPAAAPRLALCDKQTLRRLAAETASSGLDGGPPPLLIKPSAMWWGQVLDGDGAGSWYTGPVKMHGIWCVLYSNHSSYAETERFVRCVGPRAVFPLRGDSRKESAQ